MTHSITTRLMDSELTFPHRSPSHLFTSIRSDLTGLQCSQINCSRFSKSVSDWVTPGNMFPQRQHNHTGFLQLRRQVTELFNKQLWLWLITESDLGSVWPGIRLTWDQTQSYQWSGSWWAGPRPPCSTPTSPQSPSPSSGRWPAGWAQVWTCRWRLQPERLKHTETSVTFSQRLWYWTGSCLMFSCHLLTPGLSSCRSSAASSASARSSPVSPPAPWGPSDRKHTDVIT